MSGFYTVPTPKNELVKNYAPESAERKSLQKKLAELKAEFRDIPMVINGKDVFTDNKIKIHPPHERKHVLGTFSRANGEHVKRAINAALQAKPQWESLNWEQRASIFLKAAELIAGPYRDELNAATMLGQSKNAYQAEIDSACELIDFLRFNVHYMSQIYAMQPESAAGIWNRLEWRPLEGFVFALTPFNFTAIAGNLPSCCALMGNVVVWKPSDDQIYSAHVIMKIFRAAGLPDGVINLIFPDGPEAGDIVFKHPDFSGIHFTGSTSVFRTIWKEIGDNISNYKTYPRIVGETGGKDFILAHPSADAQTVATAISRGAFEYQGQKCSAASRAYIPSNLWESVRAKVLQDLSTFKMGSTEDFGNFINAVINEKSFNRISHYLEEAKKSVDAEIIAGGKCDNTNGWFVEPTIIVTRNAKYTTMCEEIFGPVLTIYVYPENEFEKTVELVNGTSMYALTGSIVSQDRYAIDYAAQHLKNAAGNFYINDKPTGAVVGQQPFGGSRASGTNDKAGSLINLMRWVSPRTIKETFVPATDYRYPFLEK
ncbi:MAG: L-glutamate gamma-semialdehyde dehydrogenase [Chitinophagales bacterium]|nr:L-glutamate gamma-semialdehyde dehydrogenase [Chitinophagales bacterium]OJV30513.1 MAG: 1-pyrroline-5-carboxylate dehydrogenase [Bacteroidetes bacterium 37-13]HRN93188.1 L-glutamate gamma-semialdehyde dehydrogenase [Chitinophagales bacterium]HRP38821.1 L-glutamate gamma-semialdehyde dehydrogenase [Chitinophagales bacterium]